MREKANLTGLLLLVLLLTCTVQAKYGGGNGTAEDPHRIATAEDLMLLGDTPEDWSSHFKLVADIDSMKCPLIFASETTFQGPHWSLYSMPIVAP